MLITKCLQSKEGGDKFITYEATKDNCTGFGNSELNAILDLIDKIKLIQSS